MQFFRVPNTDTYAIYVTTPTRFYCFTGRTNPEEKPLLQQVFNKYLNISEEETYFEAKSNLRSSRLRFWSENLVTPQAFCWMVETGIVYGQVST